MGENIRFSAYCDVKNNQMACGEYNCKVARHTANNVHTKYVGKTQENRTECPLKWTPHCLLSVVVTCVTKTLMAFHQLSVRVLDRHWASDFVSMLSAD